MAESNVRLETQVDSRPAISRSSGSGSAFSDLTPALAPSGRRRLPASSMAKAEAADMPE